MWTFFELIILGHILSIPVIIYLFYYNTVTLKEEEEEMNKWNGFPPF